MTYNNSPKADIHTHTYSTLTDDNNFSCTGVLADLVVMYSQFRDLVLLYREGYGWSHLDAFS